MPSLALAQAGNDPQNTETSAPPSELPATPPAAPEPAYQRPPNNVTTAPTGIGNPGSIPHNSNSVPRW